ncbi:MAG: 16S rRNA (cytosine(1402)-N(4))-methyltransferase [Candidatus Reconcilbacillus cellulovorans]|uniref:Ribosomal RNA small subunit methyltransferase H n=1 Tax=Candidatus Reconcilbacillus cellulovorans TaxID=1906605 RepID=A0A2A6E2D4_9BACL|nr:MAG: 16S rRNA (cytosine(1402)-N(4))-methyltransferase [Candidatus Reconcilbacillus cellulovorans]
MFRHETVMREEAVEGLAVRPGGVYVDCTVGGAGHSEAIAERLAGRGLLVGIDRDAEALAFAGERLRRFGGFVQLVKANFRDLENVLLRVPGVPKIGGTPQVDGVLYDLGVSSPQFDEAERGFSYRFDAELDMRMDREQELTAKDIVNRWDEAELARIFREYGEERFAGRIAAAIVRERARAPIETTGRLAELVKEAIPAPARRGGGHPARKVFQALRIAVNGELDALEQSLEQAVRCLRPGGRLAVISFHSLEDRICKRLIEKWSGKCVCPPGLPVCGCGRRQILRTVGKQPVTAREAEIARNRRARSAKLRVAEKLSDFVDR